MTVPQDPSPERLTVSDEPTLRVVSAPPDGLRVETTPPPVVVRPRRRLGRGSAAALVIFALVALAGVLAWTSSGRGVPKGTRVAGIDIGGLSRDEAVTRLDTALGARAREPVMVRAGGEQAALPPAEAGLAFDAQASVDAALDAGPVGLRRLLHRGASVPPVVRTDEAATRAALAPMVKAVSAPPREGSLRYVGTRPVATPSSPGRGIDVGEATERIHAAYLVTSDPVELPVRELQPKVATAEIQRALREVARPAVAGPVAVKLGDRRTQVPPGVIAQILRFAPDSSGRLVPALDGARLRAELVRRGAEVDAKARNASIRIVGNKPVVVPAKSGRVVRAADLSAAVLPVLSRTDVRVAPVSGTEVAPRFTTQEAKDLGIVEKLASFRQPFPYAPYRVNNIGRAARYISGTVLRPGQVFSMNRTVRERTPQNGYVKGFVIKDGRLREDLGGGVSTITTATWTAAFYAGMERIEQRAHSYWISRYRPGLEATVSYGALDLKFRNTADHAVLMTSSITNNSVTVSLWGTKKYGIQAISGPRYNFRPYKTIYDPKKDCVPQAGVKGFSIAVTRIFRQQGREVKRETLRTSYNPADRIHCRAEPAKEDA